MRGWQRPDRPHGQAGRVVDPPTMDGMDIDQSLERAYALGVRNQEILELLAQHCAHAKTVKSGGQGMAEQYSGLPIDARTVKCDYAKHPVGSSNNLEWIAVDFYRENCVGCPQRKPRGFPNLATHVAQLDKDRERQAQADQERANAANRRRRERAERRASLGTAEPLGAKELLDDLDLVDRYVQSGPDVDPPDEVAARARIIGAAGSAPELFSSVVIDQLYELALPPRQGWVFEALGHLARSGHADARRTLELALKTIGSGRSGDAVGVLQEHKALISTDDLSPSVLRALIQLAGTPELHGLALASGQGRVRDLRGLTIAINVAPQTLLDTLGSMLLPSGGAQDQQEERPQLLLPPGVQSRRDPTGEDYGRDADRAAAAVAARPILTALPGAAEIVARQLLESLKTRDVEDYGVSPTHEITETVARLLLEQPDLVLSLVAQDGVTASSTRRSRLLDIAERAAWHLRPRYKSTTTDELVVPIDGVGEFAEPTPQLVADAAVVERLFTFGLDRLGGDWGHRVAADAARLLEDLVNHHPGELIAGGKGIDAVLGHLIDATQPLARESLVVTPPNPLAGLERMVDDQSRASVIHELRKSLTAFASIDPLAVLDRIEPLLDQAILAIGGGREPTNPAQPNAEDDAARRLRLELLAVLGQVARHQALVSGVLRRILPRLTTHLLAGDQLVRAAAISALADACHGEQPLPPIFSDLMPALLNDGYLVVILALLDALPSLLYQPGSIEDQHVALIGAWATNVDPFVRANSPHRSDDVIAVLRAAADRYEDPLRTRILERAFALGKNLPGYEVKRHLEMTWPPAVTTSPAFAELCTRAIRDPDVHDERDEVLMFLLRAWPGIDSLLDQEIAELADLLSEEYPLAAADYVELLGRMGRHSSAALLARHIRDGVPSVPAAETARAIAAAVACAADLEAALVVRNTATRASNVSPSVALIPEAQLKQAEATVTALKVALEQREPSRFGIDIPRQVGPADRMLATMTARCAGIRALAKIAKPSLRAEELEEGADECEATAELLRTAYPQDLPTAAAHRLYAGALDVVATLARADAAMRRADADNARAHLDAAHRIAEVLGDEASARSNGAGAVSDPLVSGIAAFAAHAHAADVSAVPDLVVELLMIGLPIRVLDVPWRYARRHPSGALAKRATSHADDADKAVQPVAVCLASLDDHPLIEHAQVLHPEQLYTLSIEVRGKGWPTWADTLELELLSELSDAELILPRFVFTRPSDLAEDAAYQLADSGTLVLRFKLAPGRPATPILITGRFSGRSHGSAAETGQRAKLNIAGHPRLRLRPFDPSRDLLTDQAQVDARLLELFARLHGTYPDDQVEAFARFLTALALAAEHIQFDSAYKLGKRITEAQFHDDIEKRLRGDNTLGGRLTRRTPRALGFLDLDHDGINAELKVERTTPVTEDNCVKYLGQPAQYGVGAGRRLSILAVLDMSRKASPAGTLENYVWLMQPASHGLDEAAYPSVVGVLVINANNRVPSGYAGRRIEARTLEPPARRVEPTG